MAGPYPGRVEPLAFLRPELRCRVRACYRRARWRNRREPDGSVSTAAALLAGRSQPGPGCGSSPPVDMYFGTNVGADFRAPVTDAGGDTNVTPDAGAGGSAGTGGQSVAPVERGAAGATADRRTIRHRRAPPAASWRGRRGPMIGMDNRSIWSKKALSNLRLSRGGNSRPRGTDAGPLRHVPAQLRRARRGDGPRLSNLPRSAAVPGRPGRRRRR